MAFQAGIGPDINTFTPIGGPSAGTHVSLASTAGLSYVYERTMLTASFARGTSGGGGVLFGAQSNQITFAAARGLGQWWNIRGFVGENASIFVNYNLLRQTTNVVCVGPTCAGGFLRHQFWVGFNFDFRPIGIQ
jgi:hypothetical protein